MTAPADWVTALLSADCGQAAPGWLLRNGRATQVIFSSVDEPTAARVTTISAAAAGVITDSWNSAWARKMRVM